LRVIIKETLLGTEHRCGSQKAKRRRRVSRGSIGFVLSRRRKGNEFHSSENLRMTRCADVTKQRGGKEGRCEAGKHLHWQKKKQKKKGKKKVRHPPQTAKDVEPVVIKRFSGGEETVNQQVNTKIRPAG